MKKILLILFVIPITINSQRKGIKRYLDMNRKPKTDTINYYRNFKIVDDDTTWQFIFKSKLKKDSLIELLKDKLNRDVFTVNIKLKDEKFIGFTNYKGLKELKKVTGNSNNLMYQGYVTIDVKDYKYRVTVDNLQYQPVLVNTLVTIGEVVYSVNQAVINAKTRKFDSSFNSQKILYNYNQEFLNTFKINEEKDDW